MTPFREALLHIIIGVIIGFVSEFFGSWFLLGFYPYLFGVMFMNSFYKK